MSNRRVTKDVSDNIIAGAVLASFPLNKLDRILEFASVTTLTVKGSPAIPLEIGDNWFLIDTNTVVSTATDMDTGSISNGKDYYVYACDDSGTLVFKISLASTYPSGFSAATSRKIGGFHTLCTNVGTISGHTLTGYTANSILPQSVWDLKHRALNKNMSNAGLVYDDGSCGWELIYLGSDDGDGGIQSVYNATILDTIDWNDYGDKLIKVGMFLEDDLEFQSLARGSNEETNITGSADPVTTGGHSDTAGRRMISDIGCEDCAGALYQWLKDQSYRLDGADFAAAKTWAWYDLPGSKGSLYRQADYGDIKLIAGGNWSNGTYCGPRCRNANGYRWYTNATIGGRGRSRKL
jgi:hypothetical protein